MEKIKNMFHQPKMAIFFYVMAILGLIYTIYTGWLSYEYIAGLVAEGSIKWGSSLKDIFGYFVTNSSTYLFYTLAFLFFGYACNFLNPKPQKNNVVIEEEVQINDINV